MPASMKRTAPAARPVAMPATEAFLSVPPPPEFEAAAVALGVAVVETDVGWLATVTSVEDVDDDV